MDERLKGKPSVEQRWLSSMKESVDKEIPRGNLYNYLYNSNINNFNGKAFQFYGKTITYDEFLDNIDKCVNIFKSMGVEENDVVPLAMATIPEAAYCFYALNKMGAISCMIDPRLNEYGLKRDINIADSKTLVSITNACKKIKNIESQTRLENILMLSAVSSAGNNALKKIVGFNDFIKGNTIPRRYINFTKLLENQKYTLQQNEGYNNKPATIIFTGGTTGTHKGVLLSNEAINTTVYEHHFIIDNLEKGEKFLDILPPFIAYGLTSMHLALCFGLETIMDPVPTPSTFANQMEKYKPAVAFGGPIHWEAFARNVNNVDLSNLKFAVSGGEKLPLATEELVNEAFMKCNSEAKLIDGYGATEHCGVIGLKFGDKNSKGTVGYPLRYNKMCILDPETLEEKNYNEKGEIFIYGPSMMEGYYKNEEETKKVIIKDAYGRTWFKTGDIGSINEKGELIVSGRSKRIFVCGVNKIYPPELEEIIMQIKGIRKCVVTGVDDKELRTVPKVHIILDSPYVGDEDRIKSEIESSIKEKIDESAVPKYYSFDEDFLYTASGKIDYVGMTKQDNEELNQKILKKIK